MDWLFFLQGIKILEEQLNTYLSNQAEINKVREIKQIEKSEKAQEHCNRADGLRNLQRYEEAIKSYEEAIQIHPQNFYYWFCRGICLFELGRYDNAIDSFQKVLEITKDKDFLIGSLNYIGTAQFRLERYQEALNSLKRAIEFEPVNLSWTLILAAKCLFQLKNYEEASKYCSQAIKESSKDTEVVKAAKALRYQIGLKNFGFGFWFQWLGAYIPEGIASLVLGILLLMLIDLLVPGQSTSLDSPIVTTLVFSIIFCISVGLGEFLLLNNRIPNLNESFISTAIWSNFIILLISIGIGVVSTGYVGCLAYLVIKLLGVVLLRKDALEKSLAIKS
jgi:tetratricopeptide (TPR) repeat protein